MPNAAKLETHVCPKLEIAVISLKGRYYYSKNECVEIQIPQG